MTMQVRHILTPLTRREIPLLRRWIAQCPVPGGAPGRLTWHLSIDDRWTAYERDTIGRLVAASRLAGIGLDFYDTGLTPQESVYFRKPPESFDIDTYPYGLKSGPNLQFFRSVRHVAQGAGSPQEACLLLETDAYPLRDGWLAALDARIAGIGDFVVAGANYQGTSPIHAAIQGHFNGNSVYGVGSPDFQPFLASWEAVLLHCMKHDPRMAYDTVLDWYLHWRDKKAQLRDGEPADWAQTSALAASKRANLSDVIINIGGADEQRAGYEVDVRAFIARFPKALIAHGKCFNVVAHRIHYHLTEPRPRLHPLNQALDALEKAGISEYFSFRQGAPSDLDDVLAREFRLTKTSDAQFRACLSAPPDAPAAG
jgi:hypothetical protein